MPDNAEHHLFIFEGGRAEDMIFKKLEQNFLGRKFAIKCVYDAEVYQLYRQMKDDDFAVDIVNLLKERSTKLAEELKDYDRDSFAYVYLFFDYDAHSTLADDEKIAELLKFFDNETENGKMYISYPMVEALRHYSGMDSFKSLTVKCKRKNCRYIDGCADKETCMSEPHYKKFVADDCRKSLTNVNSYTVEVWLELIAAHLCKANYLVNELFDLPDSIMEQLDIFNKQQEKHISRRCPEVAVLSAFPLFVLDYYGIVRLREKLLPPEVSVEDAVVEDAAAQGGEVAGGVL